MTRSTIRTPESMRGRSKSLRAIVATVGLLASISVGQLVFAGAAHANCNGNGPANEYTKDLVVNGVLYAREATIPGTCNLNNTYRTELRSFVNGWRASLWIQNDGRWSGYYGPYNPSVVEVSYADNNSTSLIHLCVNDVQGNWKCGWEGTVTLSNAVNHDNYGWNIGF